MAAEAEDCPTGYVIIRRKGRYYFIPADCIGEPVACSEDEKKCLDEEADKILRNQPEELIDFAIWLEPCKHLYSVLRGRN